MTTPVAVSEYDPRWPAEFERLGSRAVAALGDLAAGIEHVGSTAVHLRTHPEDARPYGDPKRSLARAHPADREAYTDGKTAFIDRTLAMPVAADLSSSAEPS